MGLVLTVQGQIMCPHGGIAPLASLVGSPLYSINGINVLTTSNVGAVPFSCPIPTSRCTSVTGWIPGQSIMFLNGQLVLTDSAKPITNNGPGSVVVAGQFVVSIA